VNFRGEEVAVKKLNMGVKNGLAGDFIREVTVLGTLAHPNIVRLVGISCDAFNRCLLYELMPGGNLADLIELSNGQSSSMFSPAQPGVQASPTGHSEDHEDAFIFGWPDRVTCALDACLGLACLHECTLLHCDIKPENILVRENGRAALADFGLSRSLSGAAAGGKVAYTPGYDDPEWKRSGKKYTAKSDMFAMGMVILQLLTGRSAKSLGETLAVWEKYSGMTPRVRVETMCDPDGLLHAPARWELDAACLFAETGVPCTLANPDKRPTIRDTLDIFTKLSKLGTVQEMCPGLRDIYSRVQEEEMLGENTKTRRESRMQWGANLRHCLEEFESKRREHEKTCKHAALAKKQLLLKEAQDKVDQKLREHEEELKAQAEQQQVAQLIKAENEKTVDNDIQLPEMHPGSLGATLEEQAESRTNRHSIIKRTFMQRAQHTGSGYSGYGSQHPTGCKSPRSQSRLKSPYGSDHSSYGQSPKVALSSPKTGALSEFDLYKAEKSLLKSNSSHNNSLGKVSVFDNSLGKVSVFDDPEFDPPADKDLEELSRTYHSAYTDEDLGMYEQVEGLDGPGDDLGEDLGGHSQGADVAVAESVGGEAPEGVPSAGEEVASQAVLVPDSSTAQAESETAVPEAQEGAEVETTAPGPDGVTHATLHQLKHPQA